MSVIQVTVVQIFGCGRRAPKQLIGPTFPSWQGSGVFFFFFIFFLGPTHMKAVPLFAVWLAKGLRPTSLTLLGIFSSANNLDFCPGCSSL